MFNGVFLKLKIIFKCNVSDNVTRPSPNEKK